MRKKKERSKGEKEKVERGSKKIVSRRLQLPLDPQDLKDAFYRIVKNPQTLTFFKLLLVIDELQTLCKNPKHSLPNHFEKSAEWFEERISRVSLFDGSRVRAVAVLTQMGLIELVILHRASIAPRATTYRFKVGPFDVYDVDVPANLVEKFKKLKSQKKFYGPWKNEYKWIQQSLCRISASPSLIGILKRKDIWEKYARVLTSLDFRVKVTRGIYITHVFCSFPPKARSRLLFDEGMKVARLDISSAHILMLPWLLEDMAEKIRSSEGKPLALERDICNEVKKLRNDLSKGDFYVKITNGRERKAGKKDVLSWLNGADFPAAKYAGKRLNSRYPILASLLCKRRMNTSKSKFFDELQGRVTEILLQVVRKCLKGGIPCIPVTDELIVPFKDRLDVLKWMHLAIYKKTGVRGEVDGVRDTSN